MRRARPPASSRPTAWAGRLPVSGGIVLHAALAAMAGFLLADRRRIAVVADAPFAGERHEALALGAANQGQVGLLRQLDAPGGEARARDQDRDSHLHGLDDHLAGEPPGRIEN